MFIMLGYMMYWQQCTFQWPVSARTSLHVMDTVSHPKVMAQLFQKPSCGSVAVDEVDEMLL